MKTLLTSLALWDMVEITFEEPENVDNLSTAKLKDLKSKKSRDAEALSLIQREVVNPIFPRIMRATNAMQSWKTSQKEYEGDMKVRALNLQNLRKELENIKIEKNEVADEFSDRIIKVLNQMKSCGEKLMIKE